MTTKFPPYVVFQDKETLGEFIKGDNSDLNRELLELYRIITDNNTDTDLLNVMNKAWYIAKWCFMQKEPKLLLFDRELKQYIEKTSDSDFEDIKYAMLFAYYILKRQQTLPAKISEFLPEIKNLYISYYGNNDQFTEVAIDKMSDFMKSHNDSGYKTNLYFEIKTFYPKQIREITNNFNLKTIKKILPYYGNVHQQLCFISCVEEAIKKTSYVVDENYNLPF